MKETEIENPESKNTLYRPDFGSGIWMVWQVGEKDPWAYFENKYGRQPEYYATAEKNVNSPKDVKRVELHGLPPGVIWIC